MFYACDYNSYNLNNIKWEFKNISDLLSSHDLLRMFDILKNFINAWCSYMTFKKMLIINRQ